MLGVFGPPKTSEPAEKNPNHKKRIIWNKYEGVGEYPGEFIIETDDSSGVIVGMFLLLGYEQYISPTDAIKRFGKD